MDFIGTQNLINMKMMMIVKTVKVVVKNYGVRKVIQTYLIHMQVIAFYAKEKYKGVRDEIEI